MLRGKTARRPDVNHRVSIGPAFVRLALVAAGALLPWHGSALDWSSSEAGVALQLAGDWDQTPADRLPPSQLLVARQHGGAALVQLSVLPNVHHVTASELLATVRTSQSAVSGVSMLQSQELEHQHLPALEYRAALRTPGGDLTAVTRMIPVGDRIYQIAVAWPASAPEPLVGEILAGLRIDEPLGAPRAPASRGRYLRMLVLPGLVALVAAALILERLRSRKRARDRLGPPPPA
jgi:hypothetical protein